MNKKIVFQPVGQPLAVIHPADCDLSIVDIGKKDVPAGLPFWIIDENEIPEDRSMRNAWVIDEENMPQPDGIGGTFENTEQSA